MPNPVDDQEQQDACENCAGQKHTDMGTTLCPECGGTGLDAHRRFMGPLADWATSLGGLPVSTEKLAELVKLCSSLSCKSWGDGNGFVCFQRRSVT